MHAYVYKSLRKADTYVFLADRDGFDCIPDGVRTPLEPLRLVLEVDLGPGRTLARASAEEVRGRLAAQGFYLQLPPPTTLDPLTEDWGTDG